MRPSANAASDVVQRGFTLSSFCVWAGAVEPLSFASVAAAGLARVIDHGPPAVALLGFRLITTGLGVAAARAVWAARAGGRKLALLWIGLSAAALILTFATPYFPSNRPPGTKRLELAGLLAIHAAGAIYLLCSRHVHRFLRQREAGGRRMISTAGSDR